MKTLANIIWHIPFLGFLNSLYLIVAGIILCLTIVGIPMGLSLFQLAKFFLAPFSKEMVDNKELEYLGQSAHGTTSKVINTLCLILYFPFGLFGVIYGFILMIGEALTIIGIPCAIIWWKILPTIFNPFGKVCVTENEAKIIVSKRV